jgi:hypothetical protein
MCASSCVKPRTRNSPCSTPLQLIEFTDKEVVAKGHLRQLSGYAQGDVPAQGMYLEASGPSFRIMEPGKE